MKDTLKQYVALRSGLVAEKSALEARLREVNKALGESSPAAVVAVAASSAAVAPAKRRGRPPGAAKAAGAAAAKPAAAAAAPKAAGAGRGRGRGRSGNGSSLKEAAVKALEGGKSLSRQELLKAVVDSGYKFTAKDPLNSLSTLVYSSKKVFKAKGGMISLI